MTFHNVKAVLVNKMMECIKDRFNLALIQIMNNLNEITNKEYIQKHFNIYKEKFQSHVNQIGKNCKMIEDKLFKLDNSLISPIYSLENISKLQGMADFKDNSKISLFDMENLINAIDISLYNSFTNNIYFLKLFEENFCNSLDTNQFSQFKPITLEDLHNNNIISKNSISSNSTFSVNKPIFDKTNKISLKNFKEYIPKDKRPIEYSVNIIGLKKDIHKDKDKISLVLKQRFKYNKIKNINIYEKDDVYLSLQIYFENEESLAEFMMQKSFNLAMDNTDVYFNQKQNKEGNRFYVTYNNKK